MEKTSTRKSPAKKPRRGRNYVLGPVRSFVKTTYKFLNRAVFQTRGKKLAIKDKTRPTPLKCSPKGYNFKNMGGGTRPKCPVRYAKSGGCRRDHPRTKYNGKKESGPNPKWGGKAIRNLLAKHKIGVHECEKGRVDYKPFTRKKKQRGRVVVNRDHRSALQHQSMNVQNRQLADRGESSEK